MSLQEQTEMPLYDFMYGKFLLKDLFDVVLNEDDYVERAYMIFRQINTLTTYTHLTEVTIPDSCIVTLPCNILQVEAVTLNTVNLQSLDVDVNYIYYDYVHNDGFSMYVADALQKSIKNILPNKATSHQHPLGVYIPYELHGKTITVDKKWKGTQIYLMYKGLVVDHQGNPCLFRKQTEAIAYKLAFLDAQKRSFKGDPIGRQAMMDLKPQVNRLIQAAKIPDSLSQNFLDRMLSAQTRHDRKIFYSSYRLQQ